MDMLGEVIKTLIPIGISVAGSLACQWQPDINTSVRLTLDGQTDNQGEYIFYRCSSAKQLNSAKWRFQLSGAPPNDAIVAATGPVQGQDAFGPVTMGNLSTFFIGALVCVPAGETPAQLDYANLDQVSTTVVDSKVYKAKELVYDARVLKFYGYADVYHWDGGYKNASAPGPFTSDVKHGLMQTSDRISLVYIASNNFMDPANSLVDANYAIAGYFAGTISMSIGVMKNNVSALENQYTRAS